MHLERAMGQCVWLSSSESRFKTKTMSDCCHLRPPDFSVHQIFLLTRWPKMTYKVWAEGWSPPLELEVGPRSLPYILVKVVKISDILVSVVSGRFIFSEYSAVKGWAYHKSGQSLGTLLVQSKTFHKNGGQDFFLLLIPFDISFIFLKEVIS